MDYMAHILLWYWNAKTQNKIIPAGLPYLPALPNTPVYK